jgi:hypothetical protein
MMKSKFALGLCAAASLWLSASDARADGMSAAPSQLATPVRDALAQEIAQHRVANPGVYKAVRNVKGVRPDVYRQFRNPIPIAEGELRALGAEALLPMLEALAFDAPDRNGLSDDEWRALEAGMLKAVGVLRDNKAAPVVRVIFAQQAGVSAVSIEAAEALGRICDKQSFDMLVAHAQPGQALRSSAVQGLGECRTIASAKALAALVKSASPAEVETFAAALGSVASSWAWAAMGDAYDSESDAVRQLVVATLMEVYAAHEAPREAVLRGIIMADHPNTLGHIQKLRAGASGSLATALDKLESRYNRVQSRK